MGDINGQQGPLGVMLTREARWFYAGSIPSEVRAWFESSDNGLVREHRVDLYDLEAAHRGMGVKLRDSGLFDSKLRLSASDHVELAPGLWGHIEDWLKITDAGEEPGWIGGPQIEVNKEIVTRRLLLTGEAEDYGAGCEVELAEVRSGSHEAWTVCFETFGPPTLRQQALRAGLAALLSESPLPECLEMRAEASCSYPEWISRTHSDREVVGTVNG